MLTAGCDALVRKPYREQELFETLGQAFRFEVSLYETGRDPKAPPAGSKPGIAVRNSGQRCRVELLSELHQAAVELDTTRTLALIRAGNPTGRLDRPAIE